MKFTGLSKTFSLKNEDQYNTIGSFWDEMSLLYGMENLQGLGYKWDKEIIYYAIGLKNGILKESNLTIDLPDNNWVIVHGKTDDLKNIYNKIYKDGPLKYEIETFNEDGTCKIQYYR
jgi:predicted transcriptional regulator YdeE